MHYFKHPVESTWQLSLFDERSVIYRLLSLDCVLIQIMPRYYTIIDFNEVDIRIYLPLKVIFTEAAMSTEIEVNNCLLYDCIKE